MLPPLVVVAAAQDYISQKKISIRDAGGDFLSIHLSSSFFYLYTHCCAIIGRSYQKFLFRLPKTKTETVWREKYKIGLNEKRQLIKDFRVKLLI